MHHLNRSVVICHQTANLLCLQISPEQILVYILLTRTSSSVARKCSVSLYVSPVCRRLDYFVLSERLLPHLCGNIIRKEVYGSDHCPLVLLMAMD